jgi:hypothetical protein
MSLHIHGSQRQSLMPHDAALERVFPVVFGDPILRDRLLGTTDPAEFCEALSEVAEQHGIELSSESVDRLLHSARRQWLERER